MNFYLARLPIFDRNQMVIGYEIIYRSSLYSAGVNDIEYKEATNRLLLNCYLDVGMDTLLGGHIAFVNFDQELIMLDSPFLLNSANTIIQLTGDIEPDPNFILRLQALKEEGYMISLSNYHISYDHPELVNMADIIQIDVATTSRSALEHIVESFSTKDQILLAKNIDTYEDYKHCQRLGFELFEGYYFCQPTLTKGKMLQSSNYNNMEILKLVNTSEPDIKLISNRIEGDLNLTLKLLRLVNTSHFFMNKIQSVQHALAMIGVDSFKNWLNLALLDSFLGDQTPEIMKLSIVRMKLMESIALESDLRNEVETLKLIGLLSVLDVLLDKNMIEAVNPLPIDKSLKLTLLGRETKYTSLYKLVLYYEKADFNKAYRNAEKANFNLDLLPDLYSKSVQWADDIYEQIYPLRTKNSEDLRPCTES